MVRSHEITDMVALHLGRGTVALQDRFFEDLGAESVDMVNIIATAERRFNLVIEEETLSRLRTVGDLAEYIQHNT